MQKLSKLQQEELNKIGDGVVCRIVLRSRHYDLGCYVSGSDGKYNTPLSAHAVAALIRKGFLVQVDCPEDKQPPHSLYYKRGPRVKFSKEYVLDEGFTCTCGKPSGKSGWVAAHLNERLTYTCEGCKKKWVLEDMFVTEA
jgi:hypothetical protein